MSVVNGDMRHNAVNRRWKVRVLTALLAFHMPLFTYGQIDPEYRMEVGVGAGLATYLGDFNGNIFKNPAPMFTAMAKYRFNPRIAAAVNVSYGQLKGDVKNEESYFPDPELREYSFKTNVLDVGLRLECNFWPYGTGFDYRGAKRVTPYIYIGIGTTSTLSGKKETKLNLPLGLGIKYKAADRVNIALEWTMHFTGSDVLDGVEDPYGIKRSGIFKNTDGYSHLRLTVSYDLWSKCKTCHNDRD